MHHSREDLLRLGITPEATKHNQHRRAAWAGNEDAKNALAELGSSM